MMNTSDAMKTLTVADLEAGYTNGEWGGYGYLGERLHVLREFHGGPGRPDLVAAADARIVAEANARGWTASDLFEWANSRYGRRFGDAWFGGWAIERREELARREIRLP